MLRRAGDAVTVEDLDTRAGTWVDGERLEPRSPTPLRPGARLRLGSLEVVLEASEPRGSEPAGEALSVADPSPERERVSDEGGHDGRPAHPSPERERGVTAHDPRPERPWPPQADSSPTPRTTLPSAAPRRPRLRRPGERGDAAADPRDLASRAPASPAPTPRRLFLRVESGRRAGEQVPVAPGRIALGTGRQNDLVLREPGVAFRHAALHLDAAGGGEVEDLGAREGVWVDGEPVPPKGRAPLRPWASLRLGPAVELVVVAELDPAEVEVRFLERFPPAARDALPPALVELAAGCAEGVLLPAALTDAGEGPARLELEEEARRFVVDLRRLVRREHLPRRLDRWVRWRAATGELVAALEGPSGALLAVQRWELLARLPDPVGGRGALRAMQALSRVVPGTERLLPDEGAELGDGFWRATCEAAGEDPLLGRFERLDAVSDGRLLALALRPRFAITPLERPSAEDPLAELLQEQAARRLWRPPSGMGDVLDAPPVPLGGRVHPKRRPTRPKA